MSSAWRVVRIGDVFKTGAGGTPLKSRKEFYEGGQIPWLMSGEVSSRDIENAKNCITEIGLNNSSAKIFPKDTVLVAMYGATAGQVGILRINAATNQAVCGIYPSDEALPEYLYYALLSKNQELVSKASGNAQPNISQVKIKSTEVPLPPLLAQKRIVAVLDEAFAGIDAAIANTEKNLANVRELFESYLNRLFDSCIDRYIGKRLSEICTFRSGGTPSKKNGHFWDGDIPWISGRDMKSTRLFDSHLHISNVAIEKSASRAAPVGSLLVLVRGMGLAHGAQVAELMVPSAFNQDIKAILPDETLFSRYLVFALKHQINSSENVMSSAAHGTLKVNFARLENLVIPIPSLSEQKEMVSSIDAIGFNAHQLEKTYQSKLESLSELKQSILKKAFSGELAGNITKKEMDEAAA